MTADYIALEDLDALAVAFLNAVVNLYVVTNVEICDLRVDLLLLDCADNIHGFRSFYMLNT